jgi:hypothetical protein
MELMKKTIKGSRIYRIMEIICIFALEYEKEVDDSHLPVAWLMPDYSESSE